MVIDPQLGAFLLEGPRPFARRAALRAACPGVMVARKLCEDPMLSTDDLDVVPRPSIDGAGVIVGLAMDLLCARDKGLGCFLNRGFLSPHLGRPQKKL